MSADLVAFARRARTSPTLVLTLSRGASQAILFLTALVLTRVLSIEDYGRFAFAQAVASTFAMWVDHGEQFRLVQQVSRPDVDATRMLRQSLRARLVLACAILPLSLVLWILPGHDTQRTLVTFVMLIGATCDGLLYMAFAVFRARQVLRREAAWTLAGAGSRLALVVVGYALHLPLLPLVALLAASKIVVMAAGLRASHRFVPLSAHGSTDTLAQHLREAMPFTLFALTGIAYFQTGVVLVSMRSGQAEAGLYQAVFLLFQGALLVPDALATARYPHLSRLFAEQRERYRLAFRRFVWQMGLAGILLAAALIAGGPLVLHIAYPAAYSTKSNMLVWFGLALALRCLNYAYGTGLHAGDGERARAFNNLASWVVVTGAGVLCIGRWGASGMAIALVIAEAALLVLEIYATRHLRRAANPEPVLS